MPKLVELLRAFFSRTDLGILTLFFLLFDANSPLSQPFTLKTGAVKYLGDLSMSNSGSCNGRSCTNYISINPRQITLADAKDQFLRAYPGFIGSAFNCILCSGKQYSIVN